MEDASVIALVWGAEQQISASGRAYQLREAYAKIGQLLTAIEANVR